MYPIPIPDVQMEYMEDRQLMALQGPGAATVMQKLAPSLDIKHMGFMHGTDATVAGIEGCRITRCGECKNKYTYKDKDGLNMDKNKYTYK